MDSCTIATKIWLLISSALVLVVEAKEYCGKLNGKEVYCDSGHCCGKYECCAYFKYYEMWWFWLVWSLITLLGCCCAYHRRRYFGNYHGAAQSYLYSTHLALVIPEPEPSEEHAFPKYKLPSYAEVEAMPNLGPPDDCEGAPPPYTLASLNWENPGPAPPYIQWYENDAVNTAEGGHVSGQTSQPHCQTTEADAEPVLSLESVGT